MILFLTQRLCAHHLLDLSLVCCNQQELVRTLMILYVCLLGFLESLLVHLVVEVDTETEIEVKLINN